MRCLLGGARAGRIGALRPRVCLYRLQLRTQDPLRVQVRRRNETGIVLHMIVYNGELSQRKSIVLPDGHGATMVSPLAAAGEPHWLPRFLSRLESDRRGDDRGSSTTARPARRT